MDQKTNNGGTNSVKPQDGEQRAVGPIVHMRADSDSMLESMFNVALKTPGTEMPLQKPLRMRNLPPSFFKPPNTGTKSPSCHSRENSLDSTSMQDPYSPAMQNVGSPQPPQHPIHINPVHQGPQGGLQQAPPPPHSGSPGTAIHHSRAHSSPAQLVSQLVAVQVPLQQQVTTQQAQQQQQQHQAQQQQLHRVIHSPHHRQASLGDNLGPLPPGWEETRTQDGQLYYMNHITKSTQWEDPRITLINSGQDQNNHIAQVGGGTNGPLPSGWEQGVTNEGEIYFIDHRTHRTQWHDPRIPLSQQVVPHRIDGRHGHVNIQGNSQQRLLLLQQKRKALQDKEAELRRMEQARLQQRLQAQAQSGSSLAEAQEMLMRQSLNEPNGGGPQNDPFLTSTQQQQQQQADLHNRQESADSGLGMGSNFNLGSIPEDIPGMESMDTGDLDTTLTGDSTPTAANTDHLMTTLPEALPLDDDIITLLNNSQQRNVTAASVSGPAAVPGPHVDTSSLTWL